MRYNALIALCLLTVASCTTEEDVPEADFQGVWKLESFSITNASDVDITNRFRLPDLTGAIMALDLGNVYFLEDKNVIRKNKVFPFFFFTEPSHYMLDSTRALGTWEVLSSGDLLFEGGSEDYLAKVVERDGSKLILRTFSDLDFFGNGYEYFYNQGLYAGMEAAAAASTNVSYEGGYAVGSLYGFLTGYHQQYDVLYESANFDPAYYETVSNALNSNAAGFTAAIDKYLVKGDPAFSLGFNDGVNFTRAEGGKLADATFPSTTNVFDLRQNYRLTYTLSRVR